jgi:RNA recognition motif-containing protein
MSHQMGDKRLSKTQEPSCSLETYVPACTLKVPPSLIRSFLFKLPFRVRWQDLKDLFRKAGTVLRTDVSLGPDNRSRGYGTVLLATAEDAGRAVDMFNGYSWQTRILEVRLDRLPNDFDNQLRNPGNPGAVTGLAANDSTSNLNSNSSSSNMVLPPFGAPGPSTALSTVTPNMDDYDQHSLTCDGSVSSNNGGRNLFVGNVSLMRPCCCNTR